MNSATFTTTSSQKVDNNTLSENFKSNGFHFHQLRREGNVVLFEKSKGHVQSFEVVRVQWRPERLAFGKTLPATEVMPSSERWGKDGWSYCDLLSARRKYQNLVEAQERPSFGIPKPVNGVLRAERAVA